MSVMLLLLLHRKLQSVLYVLCFQDITYLFQTIHIQENCDYVCVTYITQEDHNII